MCNLVPHQANRWRETKDIKSRYSESQLSGELSALVMIVGVNCFVCFCLYLVQANPIYTGKGHKSVCFCCFHIPGIRLPGFDLHRRQWSLLNRFRTGQGHCNACHKKWGLTDNELCDCGEIQTMSHVVNSCPLTKFDGGLLRLHEADEAAVDWPTTYGS